MVAGEDEVVDAMKLDDQKPQIAPAGMPTAAQRLQKYSNPDEFLEKHYRVQELAELWKIGRTTVRLLVMNDPDVLRITTGKRKITYSIPASVARRIHTRLKSGGIEPLPAKPSGPRSRRT